MLANHKLLQMQASLSGVSTSANVGMVCLPVNMAIEIETNGKYERTFISRLFHNSAYSFILLLLNRKAHVATSLQREAFQKRLQLDFTKSQNNVQVA